MTLLFKDVKLTNLNQNIKGIMKISFEHARNLGMFVFLYKAGYKSLDALLGKYQINHFVSGLLFGGLIFGVKTGVNQQIVLYLLSRVIMGLATLFYRRVIVLKEKWGWVENGYGYYLLSAFCWGVVMWLFEKDKAVLQPGLKSSMDFLYKESDNVKSLKELIPYYPK